MSVTSLTPELYRKLKEENYKYLAYRKMPEYGNKGIYTPVKELPEYFVIDLSPIEDELLQRSMKEKDILIDC